MEEAHDNKKFTNPSDFENPDYLIGHSLDFHPLVDNRPLILGGVKFDYPKGLYGHSDADVVYHAVTEAIIGALQMGDIGTLFPDNDDKYLNIDSSYFLKYMKNILKEKTYEVNNLDVIIYLEEPNLKKYKLEPQNCYMIGNSPKGDINEAKKAGLNTIYIPNEHTWNYEEEKISLEKPETSVLNNILEIKNIL